MPHKVGQDVTAQKCWLGVKVGITEWLYPLIGKDSFYNSYMGTTELGMVILFLRLSVK